MQRAKGETLQGEERLRNYGRETGQGKAPEREPLMLFGSVLDEREHRTTIILDRILG